MVGVSLPWPSSLSDHDLLALVGQDILKGRDHSLKEGARVSGGVRSVEEWMAVDCAVVGCIAKGWVGTCSNERVDSDNLASVTSSFEKCASCTNGSNDGRSRSSTGVDELIADRDSVEAAPVAIGRRNDSCNLRAERAQIIDASEQFHTLGLGSSEDSCYLVAISTIGSDQGVASDRLKVSSDLRLSLARAIRVVWRV